MRMKNAVGSAHKNVHDAATIEMLKESGWTEVKPDVKKTVPRRNSPKK